MTVRPKRAMHSGATPPRAVGGRPSRRRPGVLRLTACAVLAGLLLAGCAAGPKPKPFHPPVYPPPPAKPRFVYERTLRFSSDVQQFDTADRFRLFATGASRKVESLVKPYGVAVYHGRVYVTDTVDRDVMVFDIPGRRFFQFGDDDPGNLKKPHGIAISPKRKEIYVCDSSAKHIMVYDLDGNFLRSFGDKTIFRRPTGVAVNRSGTRLYVVDTGGINSGHHHVLVFDPVSGKLLQTIGKRGDKPGEFNLPLMDTVGPDGTLYVVDGGNFRVEAFRPDGTFKFAFGSVGRMPGQFARPKGVATDKQGNIYVVDTAFGNFQIFNPKGKLLMFIGSRGQSGDPGKFMLPAGIAIDDYGRIYVVDQFFRKVDVFRPYDLKPDQGYPGG